jgi:hypothetical protein
MDDLIVIILTLIIAGAGAIGQMKKKKQATSAPGKQKNSDNIWDMFKEEVFQQEAHNETEYYIDEAPESIPYENEQGYKFDSKNEGGVIIDKLAKANPSVKNSIKERKEGFSLRKAVIYSEILNRKYI